MPDPDSMWENDDPIDHQKLVGYAVEQIFASLSQPLTAILRYAAIPHWFDEELIASTVDSTTPWLEVLIIIRNLSFVRQDNFARFHFNDDVREYLLGWWRRNEPEQYLAAHHKLVAYYQSKTSTFDLFERLDYEHEILYHLLLENERRGLDYLSTLFEELCQRYVFDIAESFVLTAQQTADQLTESGRMWISYYQASLDLAQLRADQGKQRFINLVTQTSDPVLRALAQSKLSEILVSEYSWSDAIHGYRESLEILQRESSHLYATDVMVRIGDAYAELAQCSGGFIGEEPRYDNILSRILHQVLQLPFLFYEQLVHRVRFLPNWYFGTNYQNWIIYYLYFEALRWYQRAARKVQMGEERRNDLKTQLAQAEIEHLLGRWSRARHRYSKLLERIDVRQSSYRAACVQMGRGRAFLQEGDFTEALAILLPTLDTFQHFHDGRGVGVTASLLGRASVALEQYDAAITYYHTAVVAYDTIGERLAITRIAWLLEDLTQDPILANQQRDAIQTILAQVVERHYISRFPDKLLIWFRRLALLIALPLTYLFAFVIVLLLTFVLMIVESFILFSFVGAATTIPVADLLTLVAAVVLPVPLIWWLYHSIYSLLGIAGVYILGYLLVPITNEQPNCFITHSTGFTFENAKQKSSLHVAWNSLSFLASVDYCQWQRQLDLISSSIVVPNTTIEVIIDAVTSGYERLKRDILHHLGKEGASVKFHNYDFVLFDISWLFVAILLTLGCTIYIAHVSELKIVIVDALRSGKEISPQFTRLMLFFSPTLALIFPSIVLWRLVYHRIVLQYRLGLKLKSVPFWLLVSLAFVLSLLVILWIQVLLTA